MLRLFFTSPDPVLFSCEAVFFGLSTAIFEQRRIQVCKGSDASNVILVTGSSGLTGYSIRHVIETLGESLPNEKWVFVSSRDADLTDSAATLALFERVKPTHVIHLAVKLEGIYAMASRQLEFFRLNMLINDNVLNACYKTSVKHVVSCLSTTVFPANASYPVDESAMHQGPLHESIFGYGYSKVALDVLTRAYRKQYGDEYKYTCVIPTNIFGPHDNFNIETCNVMSGLIHKAYKAKATGEPLVVWGTGAAYRLFIFSYDVARLLIWAVRNYEDSEPLILAPDESDEVSIKRAAELVAMATGLQANQLQFDTTKSDGQLRRTVKNAKLRRLLPDFKFTPIDEALQLTVDWLRENYELARK